MDVADGLLPLVEAPVGRNPDPAAVEAYEEERRLFYVGMTRAREELILLTGPEPSPFLDDLPARYVSRGTAAPRRPRAEGVQLSLF